jgi:NTP pyrophosphatase (non-canonical NTP hydrolase)
MECEPFMKKEQEFLKEFQKEMNWEISGDNYTETKNSLLNNYMLLTTEVSEIAEELRAMFNATYKAGEDREEVAFERAKEEYKENIGKEIVDCIAYLVKFANYFEVDLESTFYEKMDEVKGRINKDQRV